MAAAAGLLLAGLLALGEPATDFPQAEISNGLLRARVLLPDDHHGYYRGSRFDWSGAIASLTYKGHEYFGQWFQKYDPLLHDAIMGPVEEFRSDDGAIGYDAAKPGGLFMKVGVGLLRKLYDEPYNFARTYPLIVPGTRVVRVQGDRVEFEHELNDGHGHAYDYKKTLLLVGGKPRLVLEHSLRNTGKDPIDTSVYNHDFYMLDHLPTGPEYRVIFPFETKSDDELKEPGKVDGNELRFTRELGPQPDSVHGYITGFSDSVSENLVRVENTKAGIGVRESIDKPISKLYFWSIRTTLCPEIYIKMHIEPGQTYKWRTTYDFYLLH